MLTGALSMVRLRTGRPGLVPSPEEAEAYRFNEMERDFVDSWLGNVVHGTPDAVRQGLDDLAKRTGADELMITANAHGGAARLRSYELIADAYGLPQADGVLSGAGVARPSHGPRPSAGRRRAPSGSFPVAARTSAAPPGLPCAGARRAPTGRGQPPVRRPASSRASTRSGATGRE